MPKIKENSRGRRLCRPSRSCIFIFFYIPPFKLYKRGMANSHVSAEMNNTRFTVLQPALLQQAFYLILFIIIILDFLKKKARA